MKDDEEEKIVNAIARGVERGIRRERIDRTDIVLGVWAKFFISAIIASVLSLIILNWLSDWSNATYFFCFLAIGPWGLTFLIYKLLDRITDE